jgi:hypothetical protein
MPLFDLKLSLIWQRIPVLELLLAGRHLGQTFEQVVPFFSKTSGHA